MSTQETTIPVRDYEVIEAMQRLGGDFIRSLAIAAQAADTENLATIKAAFSRYWQTYTEIAIADKKAEAEL